MNIVFFGTSFFASQILSFLHEKKISISVIVTKPDRKKGRLQKPTPTPVKEVATALGLPCFQPEKASTEEFISQLQQFNPDLFLVIAYGEIVKPNLLAVPARGSINVHASLLPKYRGAAPIRRALLNGEEKTGITIIEMAPEMDAGNMLGERAVYIPENMTFGELEQELIEATKQLLPEILEEIKSGVVKSTPQDHSQATFAKKITKEEAQIYWDRPAFSIHNQIRAFSPKPGAWTEANINEQKKRLKILRSEVKPIFSKKPPGTILEYSKNGIVISCKEASLSLLQLQLEGKKSMSYREFIQGIKLISL